MSYQYVTDYWSNFPCQQGAPPPPTRPTVTHMHSHEPSHQGAPVFNTLVWGEPLNSGYQHLASETRNILFLYGAEVFWYIEPFRHDSWVWYVDRQSDRLFNEPSSGLPPPPTRPTVTHMHSHEPSSGLPPPPTRPTVTHMHNHKPVDYQYFPPGPQLPSQPSSVTTLRPVPTYTVSDRRT